MVWIVNGRIKVQCVTFTGNLLVYNEIENTCRHVCFKIYSVTDNKLLLCFSIIYNKHKNLHEEQVHM